MAQTVYTTHDNLGESGGNSIWNIILEKVFPELQQSMLQI